MLKTFVACALAITSIGGASAGRAADLYRMQLSISRAGVLIGKPRMDFEANKNVDLTVTPSGGTVDQAVRLQVALSDSGTSTSGVRHAHLMVFEKVGGKWVLRSEPEVEFLLGAEVALTIGTDGLKRPASPLGIDFRVDKLPSATTAQVARD